MDGYAPRKLFSKSINTVMRRLILYFTISLSLFSCSDKQSYIDPFEGTDNYIYSFILHIGKNEYRANISGGEIRVSVPAGTPLEGAKAYIELAEKAVIFPDPADINDWSAPQIFTVTSYSGRNNSYNYSVTFTEIFHNGDIVLSSQDEIDNFVHTGIANIDGDLIIGNDLTKDSIDNLKGLTNLKNITGRIEIKRTFSGKNLSGLENIEQTGSLIIGTKENIFESTLEEIHLPSLKTVNKDISVYAENLENVILPNLETVSGRLQLHSINPFELELENIHKCGTELYIYGGAKTIDNERTLIFGMLEYCNDISIPRVTDAVAFPILEEAGIINISAYTIDFPELVKAGSITTANSDPYCPLLARIDGSLSHANTTLELPCLEYIGGDIKNAVCPLLKFVGGNAENLDAPLLETIEGTWKVDIDALSIHNSINYAGGLEFTAAASVTTTLDISLLTLGDKGILMHLSQDNDNTSLLKIIGPEYLPGQLSIQSSTNYEADKLEFAIEGFKDVGSFYFTGVPCIVDFIEVIHGECLIPQSQRVIMEKLVSVGTFTMWSGSELSLPNLINVDKQAVFYGVSNSLPMLRQVGDGSLSGTTDCLFINIHEVAEEMALPSLKTVNGNFIITYYSYRSITCKTISAPLLETVSGSLTIGVSANNNNQTVTGLDFTNLAAANRIEIMGFRQLYDFESFASVIPVMSNSKWRISGCGYNPTYQNMLDGKYTEL